MKNQSLNTFIEELSKVWGPVNSELTKKAKALLTELITKGTEEDWVKDLLSKKEPNTNVYQSEEHGFILQAHVEQKGDVSVPHDHGNGWVLYATMKGRVEMGIYHKVIQPDGTLKVIQKDLYTQKPGQCNIYLQGDIHDTKTVEDDTIMLRLTSCDFSKEVEEGRLIRFMENSERW
ncbi:hypothetical protein [Pseudoalteromonas peptidolytica]|uniref:hypothetical protein n=1 Tax=Pseudoalteromonas peptidolytica TaxID=61150 RepID=UPI00298E5FFB|nr:hypothetical protein [Pseudoalteromonas peptidolytica]MDW7548744.1 hypothetical protein [Pseudoalteromonas peptidolytica]